MVKKRACVFISGKGSNLKSLIHNTRNYNFPININLVISNNYLADGILFAKKNSIPYFVVDTSKRNFENLILQKIKKNKIDIICLAGYMKILSQNFIKNFGKKILNIHPSLLPKFKGLNTFYKIIKNREVHTGCTVNKKNKKLDSGKIIVQKKITVCRHDSVESLKYKTQRLEYRAYPEALIKIFRYN